MIFVQDIEQALSRQLRELATGACQIREPRELRRMVQVVREKYGGGKAGLATPDRLEAAVVALCRGARPSKRQLLFLAQGFSRPTLALGGKSVLESALGIALLERWEAQAREGCMAPMHWKGLFRSFLQAAPGPGADRLRRLLSQAAESLAVSWRKPPAWWEAIGRHQSLLGTSPCHAYMKEMIDEGTELLDDLRDNTDVPPGSWFWTELVKAMKTGLEGLTDTAFRSKIPYLLSLPGRIPGSLNDILAAVLSRYAQCDNHSRHSDLLQFALKEWQSPQLRTNNLWELAGTAAKQMVCGWLAQEDLEDFYQVCRGHAQIDQRRLKFWLRFTRQMDYTQILMGGDIRYSSNTDVRDFIAKKDDRLGYLTSGPASNNAILMQIGGWVFVEFSETNNACYGYPVSGSNINLGRRDYSIYDLKKRAMASSWLTHMDGHLTWEEKFLAELRAKGVFPDGQANRPAKRQPSTATRSGAPVPPTATPLPLPVRTESATRVAPQTRSEARTPQAEVVSPDEILRKAHEEFLMRSLSEMNVEIVDHRDKGGALWVYPRVRALLHTELLALGLRYKALKNGYYLP